MYQQSGCGSLNYSQSALILVAVLSSLFEAIVQRPLARLITPSSILQTGKYTEEVRGLTSKDATGEISR